MISLTDYLRMYSRMQKLVNEVFEGSGAKDIEIVDYELKLFTLHIKVRYKLSGKDEETIVKFSQSSIESGKKAQEAIEKNKKRIFGE